MRQALFDEFQQIEWQARVVAIRERLDEQRLQRQEQEREQEQEADRQVQEQRAQADRQVVQEQQKKARMAANLQWHGDRLFPGEHCESHLLEFRNVVELEGTGAYRYASDYAYAALRNVDKLFAPKRPKS